MACPDERLDEPEELRCDNGVLHGIIKPHNGVRCFEVKCRHYGCTKGKAVSVFHYFSLLTGDLVDTVTYQDPGKRFSNGRSA